MFRYPNICCNAYEHEKALAARKQCNKHISDHRPVWALFHATTTTTTHAAGFQTAKHTPTGMLHAEIWSPTLLPAVQPTPKQHGSCRRSRRRLFRDDESEEEESEAEGSEEEESEAEESEEEGSEEEGSEEEESEEEVSEEEE